MKSINFRSVGKSILPGLIFTTLLLCFPLFAHGIDVPTITTQIDPLDNWHWRNPLPQGNALHAITYGNGAFVAVGDHGTIITSLDGVTWTNRTSGTPEHLYGITYGDGTFVAVGDSGTILTSPDGVTWTIRASGASLLSGVTYGNAAFVAVGDHGTIITSLDGVTWTIRTSGTPEHLYGITYGDGTFVAVGDSGTVLTSPDGVTWTIRSSGTLEHLYGITYGNGTFVAVGDTILTSPDGVTWTKRVSSGQGVTYGNGTFVAVGGGRTILTSPDGATWTIRSSGTSDYLQGVTYGNGTFVAVGDNGTILTSPDGVTWTIRASGTSEHLYGITYGNGTFVAVGDTILTSPDGATWTIRSSGTFNELRGVTYGDGTFVAVGFSGTILTSPDGVTWTIRSSGPLNHLYGITYGNGTFVAVGSNGTILTSPDGVTWTTRSSGASKDLEGVAYGDGTFVAVGYGSTILTSPDGVTWTIRASGASLLSGVTYGNGTFVAVATFLPSTTGNILTSPDGVTWTIRASGTLSYSGVTYGNGTFVAVGNTILTSPDGVTWTTRSSGTSKYLEGVAYGDGTFVAVGIYCTILQSDPVTDIPHIYANPTSLNFGEVIVGSPSDKQVTVKNDGNANLIIGTITSPSLPFSKIADNCSGETLSPGASCTVTYQFSPTSAGTFSSNSNIPSNDPDENPVTVSLNGVGVAETVSIPNILTGPITGTTGVSYSYTTGGSTSSFGHTVEYQFDWKGDGSDLSPWGASTQSKTWTSSGTYSVKTRARCATDNSVTSSWSSALSVTIANPTETISTPNIPTGPTSGTTNNSYSYSTGGSISSLDHPVEYQFDWKGDGTDLSSWGTTTRSKIWTAVGTYNVRARARCATHTDVVSSWSGSLSVNISPATPGWTAVSPPTVSSNWFLSGLHFTSSSEGWAVGTDLSNLANVKGVLLHYFNDSWTAISTPDVKSTFWQLFGVHFTSSEEGWAVGSDRDNDQGLLLHYSNGAWSVVTLPPVSSNLVSLHFSSSDEGWAVGSDSQNDRGVMLHYSNGSWANVSPPNVSSFWYLTSVYFPSPEEGWAVGFDFENKKGVLLHYLNGSWGMVTPPGVSSYWHINSIHLTSPGEGWAVGTDLSNLLNIKGVILHYHNGSWTATSSSDIGLGLDNLELMDVYFTSPDEGWAVGSQWPQSLGIQTQGGVLLRYLNGAWSAVSPPYISSNWYLSAVHFPSPVEGWAVGLSEEGNMGGVLLRFFNSSTETISTPTTPSGPTNETSGTSYSYSTGGSTSNLGHSIEYRFDWGDGTYSNWSSSTTALKSWSSAGTYTVKAQARCAADTFVVSVWSSTLSVTISNPTETISTPNIPTGPTSGTTNNSYSYSAGGSASSLGHPVQYLIDWGDGTNSEWLPVGTTSASKSWSSAGTYSVKAQARCSADTSIISDWSPGLTVNILAPITLQSPSDGTRFAACSLYSPPTFYWTAGETFKGYEIQFSPDSSLSSIPVKVKTTTSEATITSSTWKRVLLTPEGSEGTVHWRVVGTRANRTKFTSEFRSIIIDTAQAVGNPNISSTSKGSPPELSWKNNCNTKFKVWFGSDEQFTKKKAFAFNIKNPNDNEAEFMKVLTFGQWMAVRRVVKDTSGSTIYWYVESWDGLKRYNKTDVMSFVLTE